MGKYQAIVVDLPVPFRTYTGPALPTRRLRQASAASHYELMFWKDIHGLAPYIAAVAAPDCALFLWVCNPHIPEMLRVLDSWQFEFKTVAKVWVKYHKNGTPFSGLGFWTRANTEQVFFATRGAPKRIAKNIKQVEEMLIEPEPEAICTVRERHSQKPEQLQDDVERLVNGPYLELFARRHRPGWTCIGNELDGLDITESLTLVAQDKILPTVQETAEGNTIEQLAFGEAA
jgi:N6-adenosine-specific RNA methylase IME4